MKKRITIVTLLFIPIYCFGEIPPEAADLLEKHKEWELEQGLAFKKRLEDKRSQVVAALKAQMDSRTRSGDLDGAVAIKAEIDRLETKQLRAPSEQPEHDDRGTSLGRFLLGTKWEAADGGKSITFVEPNLATFVSSGEEKEVRFIVEEPQTISLYWSAKPNKCVFDPERTFFEEVSAVDASRKVRWTIVADTEDE